MGKCLYDDRGKFNGPEPVRLAILKLASTLKPAYIDVEFLAADFFFSGIDCEHCRLPRTALKRKVAQKILQW